MVDETVNFGIIGHFYTRNIIFRSVGPLFDPNVTRFQYRVIFGFNCKKSVNSELPARILTFYPTFLNSAEKIGLDGPN